MTDASRIQGVVLAGGLSRRMGRDKAEIMLRDRSLLARACERLAPQCQSLAISRHADQTALSEPTYPIVADRFEERAGPLAGVLASLDWTAAHDPAATHVATVSVDMPFVPRDLVARLAAARDACEAPIACAASGGRLHPVAALWPVAIRDYLRALLVDERIRRVATVLDRFGFVTADWPVEPCDPFLNVNTPEDVAQATAIAAMVDG